MSLDHYQQSKPKLYSMPFRCSECSMSMRIDTLAPIISSMKGYDWYRMIFKCPECGHHEIIHLDPKEVG